MPNAIMTIEQYNGNSIFFCEPIKNNIMLNGDFIRMVYSTKHVTMNSIYLKLPFCITSVSKYYNKCKYEIELTSDIDKIKSIEMDIIQRINTRGKRPQYNIYETLQKRCVKNVCEYKEDSKTLVLKMSGIWETDDECGITYKFVTV
jgi:hypothetical protein